MRETREIKDHNVEKIKRLAIDQKYKNAVLQAYKYSETKNTADTDLVRLNAIYLSELDRFTVELELRSGVIKTTETYHVRGNDVNLVDYLYECIF